MIEFHLPFRGIFFLLLLSPVFALDYSMVLNHIPLSFRPQKTMLTRGCCLKIQSSVYVIQHQQLLIHLEGVLSVLLMKKKNLARLENINYVINSYSNSVNIIIVELRFVLYPQHREIFVTATFWIKRGNHSLA